MKYHMQKCDVGKILAILDFDAQKSKKTKIVNKVKEAKQKRHSDLMRELEALECYDSLKRHVETYGWADAKKNFKGRDVDLLARSAKYGLVSVEMPHSSVIKRNKGERNLRDSHKEIEVFMVKGKSAYEMARLLAKPFLTGAYIRDYVLSLNPDYTPVVSDDTRSKLSTIAQKKKATKQKAERESLEEISEAEMISFLFRDFLSLKELSLHLRCDMKLLEDFLLEKFSINLSVWMRDPLYSRVRFYAKRHRKDFSPSQAVLLFLDEEKISLPRWSVHYPNLYRALVVLDSAELTQRFITKHQVPDVLTISSHLPIGSYSNLAGYLNGASEIFDFYVPEKWDVLVRATTLEGLEQEEAFESILSASAKYSNTASLAGHFDVLPAKMYAIIKFLSLPIHYKISSAEEVVAQMLDSLSVPYKLHYRKVLAGQEVDFYIPQAKIAIEVNPTHTHNTTAGFRKKYPPRSAQYHLNKSKAAFSTDVTLLHLYDWDLYTTEDRVKTKYFLKLMIFGADQVFYARQTKVVRSKNSSTQRSYRAFLEKYHRQGAGRAQHYYGLTNAEGKLIAVASFSVRGQEAELKRLAFLENTQVRFGLSKFIRAFSRDFSHVNTLYSYSNNDYGKGNAYKAAGFTFVRFTKASVRWVNPSDPHDSYSWQVATPWSASSGILSRALGSKKVGKTAAEDLVATELPHRTDSGKGYVAIHTAGSILWKKDL